MLSLSISAQVLVTDPVPQCTDNPPTAVSAGQDSENPTIQERGRK